MNTSPVYPVTVTSGGLEYPDVDLIVEFLERYHKVIAFDAVKIASEAGSRQAANVVMVGAASGYLPLDVGTMLDCVKKMVPPKTIDINVKAFEMGRAMVDL
jgi:indolepyruvate ferredoxin oxidoreductase beta subunit